MPNPPPPPEMASLQQDLEALVALWESEGARYGISVTDLQTGQAISINGDRTQLSGCLVNLFVLALVEQDIADGLYALEEVEPLVDEVLLNSNAPVARLLYEWVGGGDVLAGVLRLDSLLRDLDLGRTVVDHPPGFGEDSVGVDPNNWVTANDSNRFLAALYTGTLLPEPQRSDLLIRMTHVSDELNYLTGATPGGLVAHKNGFFEDEDGAWVDTDAGIVQFEVEGHQYAYALTFLAEGLPYQWAEIELGQSVASLVWSHFTSRYGVPEARAEGPPAPGLDPTAEGPAGVEPAPTEESAS